MRNFWMRGCWAFLQADQPTSLAQIIERPFVHKKMWMGDGAGGAGVLAAWMRGGSGRGGGRGVGGGEQSTLRRGNVSCSSTVRLWLAASWLSPTASTSVSSRWVWRGSWCGMDGGGGVVATYRRQRSNHPKSCRSCFDVWGGYGRAKMQAWPRYWRSLAWWQGPRSNGPLTPLGTACPAKT